MPVTGLPAALEVMLSTLLDSETMSSFKVFGERNATVVVLRFTSQVGQPSTVDRSTNCWRKKPPSQIRRDRRRRNRQQSTNLGNLDNPGEPALSRVSPSVAGHDSAERYSPLASLPAMPTTQFSTSLLDARENPAEMRAGGGSAVDTSGILSECTASTAVTEPTADNTGHSETVKQIIEDVMRPINEECRRYLEAERLRREAEEQRRRYREEAAADRGANRVSSQPSVSSDASRSAAASPPRPRVDEESTSANLPSRRQQPWRSRKR